MLAKAGYAPLFELAYGRVAQRLRDCSNFPELDIIKDKDGNILRYQAATAHFK